MINALYIGFKRVLINYKIWLEMLLWFWYFLQAIQGGHAVLLGMSYSTGRCTLARLAAYIAHCKVRYPIIKVYIYITKDISCDTSA